MEYKEKRKRAKVIYLPEHFIMHVLNFKPHAFATTELRDYNLPADAEIDGVWYDPAMGRGCFGVRIVSEAFPVAEPRMRLEEIKPEITQHEGPGVKALRNAERDYFMKEWYAIPRPPLLPDRNLVPEDKWLNNGNPLKDLREAVDFVHKQPSAAEIKAFDEAVTHRVIGSGTAKVDTGEEVKCEFIILDDVTDPAQNLPQPLQADATEKPAPEAPCEPTKKGYKYGGLL